MSSAFPQIDPDLKQTVLNAKAFTGSQHTQTAVLKATSTDVTAPKKKHVNYLMDYLHNGGSPEKVERMLSHRTTESHWVIAYKALCVYHLLIRDGDLSFIEHLSDKPTIFSHMHNYNDRANNEGFEMSRFIRRYANYLEEKVAVYRLTRHDYIMEAAHGKRNPAFPSLTNQQLLEVIAALQGQTDVLLEMDMHIEDLTNATVKMGYILLMRDCIKLYVCLNDAIINVLDRYFTMPKTEALLSLQAYELFVTETEKIAVFLEVGRNIDSHTSAEVPDLKTAPTSLIKALRDYIETLDSSDGTAPKTKKEKQAYKLTGPSAAETKDAMGLLNLNAVSLSLPPPSESDGRMTSHQPARKEMSEIERDLNLLSFDDSPDTTTPITSAHNTHTANYNTPKTTTNIMDLFDPVGPAVQSNPFSMGGAPTSQPLSTNMGGMNSHPMMQPFGGQSNIPQSTMPQFYSHSQPATPFPTQPSFGTPGPSTNPFEGATEGGYKTSTPNYNVGSFNTAGDIMGGMGMVGGGEGGQQRIGHGNYGGVGVGPQYNNVGMGMGGRSISVNSLGTYQGNNHNSGNSGNSLNTLNILPTSEPMRHSAGSNPFGQPQAQSQ
eukprot:Ihof_evm11s48 gene=Ihof_evmTU11s48